MIFVFDEQNPIVPTGANKSPISYSSVLETINDIIKPSSSLNITNGEVMFSIENTNKPFTGDTNININVKASVKIGKIDKKLDFKINYY